MSDRAYRTPALDEDPNKGGLGYLNLILALWT
jgi:hypothetical protein